MFNLKLSPPVDLYGHTVCSLEDAAYLIRQKAIADNDSDARLFVRRLRDTDDLGSAFAVRAAIARARGEVCPEMRDESGPRPRHAAALREPDPQ